MKVYRTFAEAIKDLDVLGHDQILIDSSWIDGSPPAKSDLVERMKQRSAFQEPSDTFLMLDAAAELSRLQRELDEALARIHDNRLIADGAYDRAEAAESSLALAQKRVEELEEGLRFYINGGDYGKRARALLGGDK